MGIKQGGKSPKTRKLEHRTVIFPVAFTQFMTVQLTFYMKGQAAGAGGSNNDNVGYVTKTSFDCLSDNDDGCYWLAIGI